MKLINCLRPYGEHYKTLLKDIKEDSQNEWLYFQWMGRLKKMAKSTVLTNSVSFLSKLW